MSEVPKLQNKIKRLEQQLEAANNNLTLAVSERTAYLAEQADFFRILYDIALGFSSADSENKLFDKIANSILELLNAKSVLIHLLDTPNTMQLKASAGTPIEALPQVKIQSNKCICSGAIEQKSVIQKKIVCDCVSSGPNRSQQAVDMIAVPIWHKSRVLGVYNAILDPDSPPLAKNLQQLLSYIGMNIGMTLERFNIEKQKRESVVNKERVRIAHELHDSLAQTIASLKLRSQILEKSILKEDKKNTTNTLFRIKHGINQANKEIRELIRNFRASDEIQSLHQALKDLVAQFRKESGISIYLHYDCDPLALDMETKTHVYRIAQEALANIKKHSQAHFVRIMASADYDSFILLIEDDGTGFDPVKIKSTKGKHVGIKFMHERADYIGAQLDIDSEFSEGCRIKLKLPLQKQSGFKHVGLA